MTIARCLTIAGSDSGGGAGIQADLKTFQALGCYGMSAITALTAQNTRGVADVFAVPPGFVAKQIEVVVTDLGAEWVVLKGGDRVVRGLSAEDESVDWVYGQGEAFALRSRRLPGVWHGTGCTFSAAICARLARGDDVPTSLREAKLYVQGALEHAERIGGGAHPVDHLWRPEANV